MMAQWFKNMLNYHIKRNIEVYLTLGPLTVKYFKRAESKGKEYNSD